MTRDQVDETLVHGTLTPEEVRVWLRNLESSLASEMVSSPCAGFVFRTLEASDQRQDGCPGTGEEVT